MDLPGTCTILARSGGLLKAGCAVAQLSRPVRHISGPRPIDHGIIALRPVPFAIRIRALGANAIIVLLDGGIDGAMSPVVEVSCTV